MGEETEIRQVYKCLKCGGTSFIQINEDSYEAVYDSVKHLVTIGVSGGVTGVWACMKCHNKVLLEHVHKMFFYEPSIKFPILVAENVLDDVKRYLMESERWDKICLYYGDIPMKGSGIFDLLELVFMAREKELPISC